MKPILLVTVALLAGCRPTSEAVKPPTPVPSVAVQIARPTRGEIVRNIALPAEVHAYQQATLYAKVAGYLKTINVDNGDRVTKGALLADIEVPELLADLARCKAEVAVAAVDYRRVGNAQKKAPDLVVPQTVDAAKANLDVAKANLERVETLLNFARITAPFAGVVTRRMVDPGAFIPAGGVALVTLMDLGKVRVRVPVPEPEVPLITNGLLVKVIVEELSGLSFDGTITRYSHALDDVTKTMLVEVELANPEEKLRPGMFATARIAVEKHTDALLVPVSALLTEKSGTAVFTIVENKSRKLPVTVGFNDGVSVEILTGLNQDVPVVLLGKQTVSDGQPLSVNP